MSGLGGVDFNKLGGEQCERKAENMRLLVKKDILIS